MGSTLQFPPPSNESIELVENNLLSDIEPETPEVQSKLHRWQSDLHFLKSRFSVIETSHSTLKRKIKGLFISTVALTVLVALVGNFWFLYPLVLSN